MERGRAWRVFLLVAVGLTVIATAVQAETKLVSSPDDWGSGTLRAALGSAASGDIIVFDTNVFPLGNPGTIFVESPLPGIWRGNITIDSSNTGVVLDGAHTSGDTQGLYINSDNNVVRGLVIVNFPTSGLVIEEGDNNFIEDNRLQANTNPGIALYHAHQNSILNNELSGNDNGIFIGSSNGNIIEGNTAIDNWQGGCHLVDSHDNQILNNALSRNGSGLIFNIACVGNTVTGNTVSLNEDVGIVLMNGASANTIDSNTVSNNANGIYLGDAHGNSIISNDISANDGTGIMLEDGSSSNNVEGNTVNDNNFVGIALYDQANNNSIVGNSVDRSGLKGITVEYSSGDEVRNNIVTHTRGEPQDASKGIHLLQSTGIVVSGNTIANNHWAGICMERSPNNMITGNTIQGNEGVGLVLAEDSSNSTVEGNFLDANAMDGILVIGGTHSITISGNHIENNGTPGIGLYDSYDNIVESNTINSNYMVAILSERSHHNSIQNNTIAGTWGEPEEWPHAIAITWSQDTKIIGNTIQDNEAMGVHLEQSTGNEIKDNLIDNNLRAGIDFYDYSDANDIINNTITNTRRASVNRMGMGIALSWDNHNNYISGNVIAGNAYFGINLARCHDNTIENNTIRDSGLAGIRVANSSHGNTIQYNEICDHLYPAGDHVYGFGILSGLQPGEMELNENNVYSGNYVHDNAFGIAIGESRNCRIIDNDVHDNAVGAASLAEPLNLGGTEGWLVSDITGGGGIYVNGQGHVISNNTVTHNGFGIECVGGNDPFHSEYNEITENTVFDNDGGTVEIYLEAYVNEEMIQIPVEIYNAFGLLLMDSSTGEIKGNTIYGNGQAGVALCGFSHSESGLIGYSNNNHITENLIRGHDEGIWIGPYAEHNTIEMNAILDNIGEGCGILVEDATGNEINHNDIVGNIPFGVENRDSVPLNVTNNWWGSVSGPYHPTLNPEGTGDAVSGLELFSSWLAEPLVFFEISIDIKPESSANVINPRNKGSIPVVILSTADFAASTEIDLWSLRFGPKGAQIDEIGSKDNPKPHYSVEDVNGDGLGDLVCHFLTQDAGFKAEDEEGILTGRTRNGKAFLGNDSVRIVPSNKPSDLDLLADLLQVVVYPNPVRDVHTTTFRVMAPVADDVEEMRVRIFDLSGRLVWEAETHSAELDWHTENLAGEYLANGVYLYRVQVKVTGVWISTDIGKLAILR